MDLTKGFTTPATHDGWTRLTVELPADAFKPYVLAELRYMAEDFVIEIGCEETPTGMELGFRSTAQRDQVAPLLEKVIEDSLTADENKKRGRSSLRNFIKSGFIDPDLSKSAFYAATVGNAHVEPRKRYSLPEKIVIERSRDRDFDLER
ncbi:MAG: hypothetical protein AAFV59_04515 [Pseudomonadota bacterium]